MLQSTIIDDPLQALVELKRKLGEDLSDPPTVVELKKEAYALGKRRADKAGSRDNLIYRIGYGIDAIGGCGIDPAALTGALSSASLIQEAMVKLAPEGLAEDVTMIDLVGRLQQLPHIHMWMREEGERLQWKRLAALYENSTRKFKESAAYGDPKAGWRRKAPTREQIYLASEICRLSGGACPQLLNRGEAFDFIDGHGGNPRFAADRPRSHRPEV